MDRIQIRLGTLSDLKEIHDFEASEGKYPYPLVVIRQHFDLGSVFLVADTGEKLASYILGTFNHQTSIAHIVGVMTRPEFRCKGISRKLGEELCASLSKFLPSKLQAVVSPENTASLALFKSLGFSEHHRESNYYGGGEERIVLRKYS